MEKFIINGGRSLSGEIAVAGAKNHALKMLPASLLSHEAVTITNVPEIQDVEKMITLLEGLGCRVERRDDHAVIIEAPRNSEGVLPETVARSLRASIVLLGPVLARYGHVTMPYPGGCNLGKRPIDLFVTAFEQMGAQFSYEDELQHIDAPHGLQGAHIVCPVISVTGTETILLAAVLARGTTVIENAAVEPEIIALIEYLQERGVVISGVGTHTLTIVGGETLSGGETAIIPDRIEAGSFVMLAAATRSHIRVTECMPEHLAVPLRILKEMGVPMRIEKSAIEILPHTGLRGHGFVTHEYPGFPTDLQAPMTVLLTQAEGESVVRETIYDGRLFYTDMLNTMGARITLMDPYRAVVYGATELRGKLVVSPDLRAGIAMVIAGLVAQGTTTIEHIYHIDRGYEHIEHRLRNINADITRISA